MSVEPYSDRVRSLFAETPHAGSLDGPAAVAADSHGVRIRLFADAAGGKIRRLRFLAWGCPHFIAAAEALCADYEGRPVADLEGFGATGLMQSLPVPVEKTGRILVLEDAARSLGIQLREASEPADQKT